MCGPIEIVNIYIPIEDDVIQKTAADILAIL